MFKSQLDVIYDVGYTLMNSIKFNEVDWTLVVKSKTRTKGCGSTEQETKCKIEIISKSDFIISFGNYSRRKY